MMSSVASIADLAQSVTQNTGYDSFAPSLTSQQWEMVGSYLQHFELAAGEVLITRGAPDRTVYFVESGSLSVHLLDEHGRVQLAILNPGSVVGEGAFFSHLPRSANVVATGACRMWRMTPIRFSEMANRQPNLALEITLALGAVIAKRMVKRPRRVAVT